MNDISHIDRQFLSDTAIEQEIGRFVKAQRLRQNKTQSELAAAANISRSTLSLLERGETGTVATLIQVLRVLGQLHALGDFSHNETLSPIQLAKIEQSKRKRASKRTPSKKQSKLPKSMKKTNINKTDW